MYIYVCETPFWRHKPKPTSSSSHYKGLKGPIIFLINNLIFGHYLRYNSTLT